MEIRVKILKLDLKLEDLVEAIAVAEIMEKTLQIRTMDTELFEQKKVAMENYIAHLQYIIIGVQMHRRPLIKKA